MATATDDNKHYVVVFDAETGETVTRELTADEIAALPQPEAHDDAD